MSDDDFDLDELDELEVEQLPEEKQETGAGVPLWRLVEMSHENRFLQRELADFEDFDGFDCLTADPVDHHAH